MERRITNPPIFKMFSVRFYLPHWCRRVHHSDTSLSLTELADTVRLLKPVALSGYYRQHLLWCHTVRLSLHLKLGVYFCFCMVLRLRAIIYLNAINHWPLYRRKCIFCVLGTDSAIQLRSLIVIFIALTN